MARGPRSSALSSTALAEIFDRLPNAIVVHRSGKILFANRAAAALADKTEPDALLGASVLDFVHPDSQPEAEARLERSLTSAPSERRAPLGQFTVKLRDTDGHSRVLEVATPEDIELDDGPARLLFTRDITEQTQLRRRLVTADRHSAMGTLAAAV
ncbi:MAG: PAS domain S-box protein, partial [Myxococcota bacterium]